MSTTKQSTVPATVEKDGANRGSSDVQLDRYMLHRCCIQISSNLKKERISLEAEKRILLPFVKEHAASYTHEVSRALVWRVVDTLEEEPIDRAGAWELLQEVLEECDRDETLLSTSLAQHISSFLPELIAHRWFTRVPRQATNPMTRSSDSNAAAQWTNEGEEQEGEANGEVFPSTSTRNGTERKPLKTSSRAQEPWRAVLMEGPYRKVVPAAMINALKGYSHLPVNAGELEDLMSRYSRILRGWKKIWRHDTYQELKTVVRRVEREGNYLSEKGAILFEIPNKFRDSLWRLRRRTPRPSIAFHLLYIYGWNTKRDEQQINNLYRATPKISYAIPATLDEAKKALDPQMHPVVWSWIKRLVEEKGGCLLCDTWKHQQQKCPCEEPFLRPSFPSASLSSSGDSAAGAFSTEGSNSVAMRYANHNGSGFFQPMEQRLEKLSYMEAVDILHLHDLRLPLRVEIVLDVVTKLIIEEKIANGDQVLLAFDRIRGAITGPLERHALWIHAGYNVFPSKTVFESPSDDLLSPALEKAKKELLSQRRYREWDKFLESAEVLDGVFQRGRVPDTTADAIASIRQYGSFFFCLIDGSFPAFYTPGRYARVPDEVLLVASMKDVLCGSCLEPFQRSATCPNCTPAREEGEDVEEVFPRPREPWDLRVARQLLEVFQLLHIRYPKEANKVQTVMSMIANDGRPATKFRQDELSLAVQLIHQRRTPYCRRCGIMGHKAKRCEWAAHRTLVREHLSLVDCRLDPTKIRRRMEEYRDRTRRHRLLSNSHHGVDRKKLEQDEEDEQNLREAFELLVAPYLYPPTFITAIKELSNAAIPLTAARYCTNAVQGFLLSINSSDLLELLPPLREERFPEVCVYCDSIHHRSENCPSENGQSVGEEVRFLKELRERGLTFWEYMRCRDYYQERLPTNYIEGREGLMGLIQQFEEDFNPGGVGRENFLKRNDLVLLTNATGAAILTSGSALPLETALSSSDREHDRHHSVEEDLHASQMLATSSNSSQLSQFTVTSLYGSGGFSQLIKKDSPSSAVAAEVPADHGFLESCQGNMEYNELSQLRSRKRMREEDETLLRGLHAYGTEATGGDDTASLLADTIPHTQLNMLGTPMTSEA